MQFGVFTVGDVTPDPTTGRTPTEHERIKATVEIARKAEEVGLDVFATGEHHNPPFIASAPTTTLAFIAARTERIILSTATTLITTTDPVLIAENYAKLQHLSDGRVDLMMGRGNTGPVYPWFGKDIRDGIPLAIENYHLLHRLWREEVVSWEGKYRTPLQGFTSTPRPLDGVPPFVWHGSIRSPVSSLIRSSWPSSRSRVQMSAVRRSCHTIARRGEPRVSRSQSTTVSRWLVIPIACSAGPPARSWWVASIVSSCCCSCWATMPKAKASRTSGAPSSGAASRTSRTLLRTSRT